MGALDPLAIFEASTPEGRKKKLYEDMMEGLVGSLDPSDERGEEDVFEPFADKQMVRGAIVALTTSLLAYSIEAGSDEYLHEVFYDFVAELRGEFLGGYHARVEH